MVISVMVVINILSERESEGGEGWEVDECLMVRIGRDYNCHRLIGLAEASENNYSKCDLRVR